MVESATTNASAVSSAAAVAEWTWWGSSAVGSSKSEVGQGQKSGGVLVLVRRLRLRLAREENPLEPFDLPLSSFEGLVLRSTLSFNFFIFKHHRLQKKIKLYPLASWRSGR
jgi:hypothetical protein